MRCVCPSFALCRHSHDTQIRAGLQQSAAERQSHRVGTRVSLTPAFSPHPSSPACRYSRLTITDHEVPSHSTPSLLLLPLTLPCPGRYTSLRQRQSPPPPPPPPIPIPLAVSHCSTLFFLRHMSCRRLLHTNLLCRTASTSRSRHPSTRSARCSSSSTRCHRFHLLFPCTIFPQNVI
jgi:hypothetical protein